MLRISKSKQIKKAVEEIPTNQKDRESRFWSDSTEYMKFTPPPKHVVKKEEDEHDAKQ